MDYTFRSRGSTSTYGNLRKKQGLRPFREAWWIQSQLEPYRVLRRYAFLLDWALGETGYKPSAEVLPQNARVVVFRFGHLGDILHLMPTVRQIREQRSDVVLELVTGHWNKGLFENAGDEFEKIHYFTPDVVQFNRGDSTNVLSPDEEKQFVRDIRGDGVATVFCPSTPHFSALPLIVGLQPSHYVGNEWLLKNLPVSFPRLTLPQDSKYYELDAVADYLPSFGLERKNVQLRYDLPSASVANIEKLLERTNPDGLPVVSIFPGSGWSGKCWPASSFTEFASRLIGQRSVKVYLAGSPGEKELCELIRNGIDGDAVNVAGTLSIDDSAALINRSVVVIGNDSAPVHIAAALERPTVSLWGPSPSGKWAPRGNKHVMVEREGECRGCTYWHPAASCSGNPGCITTIKVESVLDAVRQLGVHDGY